MKKSLRIALLGNPNSGKSTLFNALVRGNQEVGNYPGVTVEKKTGFLSYKDWEIIITDLPGIYNLTAHSEDERIAKDFLLSEPLDLVIQVVDATHLERHLFLTSQLMELGLPLLVALNMSDLAKKRKMNIDLLRLSNLLEIAIVPCVSTKKKGIDELLQTALQIKEKKRNSLGVNFPFPSEIEQEILKIEPLLAQEIPTLSENSLRFFALRLLEEDVFVQKKCSKSLLQQVEKSIQSLKKEESLEMQISIQRHEEIAKICSICVQKEAHPQRSFSDAIDKILLHRFFGLPIFLIAIYLTFQATFSLGAYPSRWLEHFFKFLSDQFLSKYPQEIASFLIKGLIGGVGSVLVFLPNIFLLFFALTLLELTGYMTRAAFLMDRIMHKIGLHGKSFLPMLLGFGCTVPAILATRTLESKRDRFITILILPLVACSAKLVVFGLLIPPFFSPPLRPLILFLLYFTGILLAILLAKLLRHAFLKEEHSPFLIELPPYRIPSLIFLIRLTLLKSWYYVKKAGSIILLFALLFWGLSYFPKGTSLDRSFNQQVEEKTKEFFQIAQDPILLSMKPYRLLSQKKQILEALFLRAPSSLKNYEKFFEELSLLERKKNKLLLEESYIGKIGQFIAPIFQPLGFDWRISTSLIGAFAAKEIFISQIGILFSDPESSLEQQLQKNYTPLISFCIMLFLLISTPCIATLATTRKESSSSWAFFQLTILTLLAYLLTFVVYQGGMLFQKFFTAV